MLRFLFLFVFIFSLNPSKAFSYPELGLEPPVASSPLYDHNMSYDLTDKMIEMNGIYKFTEDSEVKALKFIYQHYKKTNDKDWLLTFSQNEPVAVEFLANNTVLISLLLSSEEQGKIPEQLTLSKAEFAHLNLEYDFPGNEQDLKEKYSAFEEIEVSGTTQLKTRRHRFRRDQNGRIAGGSGNCVAIVKSLTGFRGTAGNGKGMADALLRWKGKKYKQVSTSSRIKGMVCSWNGGGHGKGHVGWFDGKCFQPTYDANCGDPGKRYRLKKCVAPA